MILWHEERPAVIERLRGLAVDGVCGNRPELLQRLRTPRSSRRQLPPPCPPLSVFEPPSYPNCWFYVDERLRASQTDAVTWLTGWLRERCGLVNDFGRYKSPEASDAQVRLGSLLPWTEASDPALNHAHDLHVRYYHVALRQRGEDRAGLDAFGARRTYYSLRGQRPLRGRGRAPAPPVHRRMPLVRPDGPVRRERPTSSPAPTSRWAWSSCWRAPFAASASFAPMGVRWFHWRLSRGTTPSRYIGLSPRDPIRTWSRSRW